MSEVPALLTADAPGLGGIFGVPEWGIFAQNGGAVIEADSVFGIEYARDYRISDYPQEQGSFESYNKVSTPFQAKVIFTIAASRIDFLNNVEAAVASLQLVSVITPEVTYPSANLTHYSYRRQRENATLILVQVWCEEVRIAGAPQFTNSQIGQTTTASQSTAPKGSIGVGFPNVENVQSTNGAPTTANGNVQPAAPTTDQLRFAEPQ